ncbi:hypothetical protein HOLleu_00768 [Holothuria leucospilota]|uniref:Uncharacterized protein n=1 Tax=Holothuria leucospilota TaxID=206669 RepID=A0A9Q1CPW7_HOLLE|nr:hypothetical protein HOLleu_00768 [Holothuria leucospilota]
MITWLKSNRQPETQVREYMKKTAPSRLKLLQESTEQLGAVLLEYPRLLDTPGMTEQDFSILYLTKAPKLYEMWSKGSRKLLKWAGQQTSSWTKYIKLPDELNEDQADLAAFRILPCLAHWGAHVHSREEDKILKGGGCPSLHRCSAVGAHHDQLPTGNQNIKCLNSMATVSEISQSYVLSFQVGTNIPQYLSLLEADLKENGEKALRKQPFVLILGDVLSPTQAFLMAERLAIPHDSTIAAIDACFKAFYVLNVEYPVACRNVWRFLQHGCYQVEGGEKEIIPTVRSLITAVCSV